MKIHIVIGANDIAAQSVDFVKMLIAVLQAGSKIRKHRSMIVLMASLRVGLCVHEDNDVHF